MNDGRDHLAQSFGGTLHGSCERWHAILEHDVYNGAPHRVDSPDHAGGGRRGLVPLDIRVKRVHDWFPTAQANHVPPARTTGTSEELVFRGSTLVMMCASRLGKVAEARLYVTVFDGPGEWLRLSWWHPTMTTEANDPSGN